MYYYENADTQTYHSEDEIDDDCVDVMCETDMIQNIKFEEETKEKFEHRTFVMLTKLFLSYIFQSLFFLVFIEIFKLQLIYDV